MEKHSSICHSTVATHRNAAAMELPGTGLVLGKNNKSFESGMGLDGAAVCWGGFFLSVLF